MKKVYKYVTGETIPEDAKYLYSCKTGDKYYMNGYQREHISHYFLVEVEE